MNAIFKRTSIRKYLDKPVEQDKIKKLLRAACAAPSACNQQPWEFYVVRNKEIIEQLSECTPYTKIAKGAPLVIVPCFRKEGLVVPMFANIDLSAAVENILLEVVELGLGAVWCGVSPIDSFMDNVRKVVNIDDSLEPFAIIPIGYPAEERIQQDRFDENRIHYKD